MLPSAHLLLDEAVDLLLDPCKAVVAVDVGQRVNGLRVRHRKMGCGAPLLQRMRGRAVTEGGGHCAISRPPVQVHAPRWAPGLPPVPLPFVASHRSESTTRSTATGSQHGDGEDASEARSRDGDGEEAAARVAVGRATPPPPLPHAREEKGAAANLRERRGSETRVARFPLDLSQQNETLTIDLDRIDGNASA